MRHGYIVNDGIIQVIESFVGLYKAIKTINE
jgi:hypothetical protein